MDSSTQGAMSEYLLIWRQKSEEGFITSEVYKEVTRSNS